LDQQIVAEDNLFRLGVRLGVHDVHALGGVRVFWFVRWCVVLLVFVFV